MATEILRPNALGDNSSVAYDVPSIPNADHWQHVDELGVGGDGFTTYIYQVSFTHSTGYDLYKLPAPSGSGVINSITVYFCCREEGYVGWAASKIKTGGIEYSESQQRLTTSWVTYSKLYTQNPNNAHSWTWDEIGALQIGVLLHGQGNGASLFGYADCTQVYVEVDYTIETVETGSGTLLGIGSLVGNATIVSNPPNSPEVLRPNAVGDETVLTPSGGANWECVDEAVADDDATYVSTNSTTFVRDLYNLPSPTGSGTINFIKVWTRTTGRGYSGMRAKTSIKSDSTITDSDEYTPPTGWFDVYKQWDTNPAAGQAWEWSDIDTLQIGVSLMKGEQAPWCTQVYVEVDYTIGIVIGSGILTGTGSLSAEAILEMAEVEACVLSLVGEGLKKRRPKSFYIGETVLCQCSVKDDNDYVNPATSMKITITDKSRAVKVDAVELLPDSVGKYHYDFQTVGCLDGKYEVKYIVTDGDRITIEKETFTLEK